jgi:Sec-independent protein translocase protein TatA
MGGDVGLGSFLVMITGFTAGISVLVLVVAGAVKLVRAGGAAAGGLGELREEVEQLRAEVDRLRSDIERVGRPPEIDEIQNRLDFAERMLAQLKGRDALPGPR